MTELGNSDAGTSSGTDDYHDYVIRDGELVGRFEDMYRSCPDPWRQDRGGWLREVIMLHLIDGTDREYMSLLDVGCGKGRFTKRLVEMVRPERSMGIDISPTALHVARERSLSTEFVAAEVPPVPVEPETLDLASAVEILWYVLPQLDEFFSEARRVLVPGGHFVLSLWFPDDQAYGNEILSSPGEIIEIVPFEPIKTVVVEEESGRQFVALFER